MNASVGTYIILLIVLLSLLIIISTLADILYSNEHYEPKKEPNKKTILKSDKSLQQWLVDENYPVILEEDNLDDTV